MEYEADREKDKGGEPSLAEMTEIAINRLKQDEDGFVLMIEGGRIDHAHHDGNAARAMEDYVAFDAAIKKALEMTSREDTLIVATADHSHTLTINGYPKRGNPLLGLAVDVDGKVMLADDGKPYTTLSYANGSGSVFPALPKDAPEGTEDEVAGTASRPERGRHNDHRLQAAVACAARLRNAWRRGRGGICLGPLRPRVSRRRRAKPDLPCDGQGSRPAQGIAVAPNGKQRESDQRFPLPLPTSAVGRLVSSLVVSGATARNGGPLILILGQEATSPQMVGKDSSIKDVRERFPFAAARSAAALSAG